MDLNAQEFITALPTESVIKTALVALGSNATLMQPTEELFLLVNAYEEVQTLYNLGSLPDILTVSPATIVNTVATGNEIDRTMKQVLQFKQHFTVANVAPVIL